MPARYDEAIQIGDPLQRLATMPAARNRKGSSPVTPPKRKRFAINAAKHSAVLRISHDRKWTTPDEVAFIVALGTHTPERQLAPRAILLQRYRDAMALRQDWGNIDEVRVFTAVCAALREGD